MNRVRRSLVDQVRNALDELLKSEQYQAGSRLPSEQELSERFGASRATLREALKSLVQEGILDCQHGKGYFVRSAEPIIHKPVTQLQSVTELMANLGYPVENRVLRVQEETPAPPVRRALHLDAGQSVLRLERVRYSRGEPLIYSVDIFPRALVPGPWQEQDWSGSLFHLFDKDWQINVVSSGASMRAVLLPPDLCAEVGVPAATPWFAMEQVNLTRAGAPVLYSQDYHRGDVFAFYVTRRRL